MREIYNAGRVVGLSQYELYVRQLLSTNPAATPLTEREWLSSSFSESCSMILRIPAGTQRGYCDFVLPENSDLCGCTIIYASMFEGEVILTEDGHWATRVVEHNRLISNTASLHPETPGESGYVPTQSDPEVITPEMAARCRNFVKITSGIMFQPGEWRPNVYYTPVCNEMGIEILTEQGEELLAPVNDDGAYVSIMPDLTKAGVVRLAFAENITRDVYLLLHGFAHKSVIDAEIGVTLGTVSDRPQDGDFLGPAMFPWGVPIVIVVTTNVYSVITADLQSQINSLNNLMNS